MACMMPLLFLGQIRISENIQTSKLATSDENALYYLDFWATWCGPCVYASEYLSVLQKQYPNNFYVVSLSEERPDVIKKFIKKRPTGLAVFSDYQGETFKKFNVPSLPYGVVLNADGAVVWQGNAADFKSQDLQRLLRRYKNRVAVDTFFEVKLGVEDIKTADYVPSQDFEWVEVKEYPFETIQVIDKGAYVEYQGDLQLILALFLKVHPNQVKVSEMLNKSYRLYIKKESSTFNNKMNAIKDNLNLLIHDSEQRGEVLFVEASHPRFWDTKQINWGEDTASYLIDDMQIQADDVSFEDIMYQLGILVKLPVMNKTGFETDSKHDWLIHYKFFTLMQSDLLDTYGIQVTKKETEYPVFIVNKKKTP